MDLQDYIQFAAENRICYLATMNGDQPRVRAFLLWFADESGFYFETQAPKAVCKQAQAHSPVEVCFYNGEADLTKSKMMRVAGEAEFLDDVALKTRLLEDMPFLKDFGSGKPEDPFYQIFRISTGEACFWTLAEQEYGRIKF